MAELEKAEEIAIKRCQEKSFGEDPRAKKPLPSRSRLSILRLFVDKNGILRVGGCLEQAPLHEDARHPLTLDQRGSLTRLIVSHFYLRMRCAIVNHIHNELRQRYCILKGRATVGTISYKCVICRWRRAQTLSAVMADLPSCRVAPFTHTRGWTILVRC